MRYQKLILKMTRTEFCCIIIISGMFLLFQNVIQGTNYLSQEGTSPPEAAIEATPETTPVRVSTNRN